jgi:hypothetical protein
MGSDLTRQLTRQPRAILVAALVLFLFGFLPGMPTTTFMFLGIAIGGMALMARELNEKLDMGIPPPDVKFFMFAEGKGADLRVPYLPDPNHEGYRWLVEAIRAGGDVDRIGRSFIERNIRYLIFNWGYVGWSLSSPGLRRDELTVSLYLLGKFLKRYGRVAGYAPGMALYQIVPP